MEAMKVKYGRRVEPLFMLPDQNPLGPNCLYLLFLTYEYVFISS